MTLIPNKYNINININPFNKFVKNELILSDNFNLDKKLLIKLSDYLKLIII
jgi:hypothetical protein